MRVLFFGTPAFAVPTLDAIATSTHELVGVVTQPDRPRGRGQRLLPSPVKARAAEIGVPVLQPERLRDEGAMAAIRALGADIGVVAAYGRILSQALLDTPPRGMVNVHASLLPRWRGAAPIHRAVMAGDAETGVTIMRVVHALDAGAMISHAATPIDPNETSAELERRLAALGGPLLVDALDRLAAGPVVETAQDEALVTYAARITKEETAVDWSRPARVVHDHIRGVQPWPLASVRLHDRRVRLLRSAVDHEAGQFGAPGMVVRIDADAIAVAALAGTVRLLEVQTDGKPPMSVRAFLSGHRVAIGDCLERPPTGGVA